MRVSLSMGVCVVVEASKGVEKVTFNALIKLRQNFWSATYFWFQFQYKLLLEKHNYLFLPPSLSHWLWFSKEDFCCLNISRVWYAIDATSSVRCKIKGKKQILPQISALGNTIVPNRQERC